MVRCTLLLGLIAAGCSSGGAGGPPRDLGTLPSADGGRDLAFPSGLDGGGEDLASPPGADLASAADLARSIDLAAPASCCGQPGDVGDSNGIGKYCDTNNDCPQGSQLGIFCATLADPHLHFCAVSCTGACMSGYSCIDTSGGSVCVPASCLPLPAGC